MLKFRIETTVDPKTQLVSASIHYPENAQDPIATTASIFPSREAAEKEVSAMIDEIFKKHGHVFTHAVDVNE